ncbi:response regulator [soil metagenome]
MTMQKKIRVVIVEDFEMTRSLLKIILGGEKFDVVGEAVDGRSGVDVCLKLKPDIVLLDLVMPIMNGIDALKEIRVHLPDALVMMVTGNDDESVICDAMANGASGYIVKPFNTASVIETMKDARDTFILRAAAKLKN